MYCFLHPPGVDDADESAGIDSEAAAERDGFRNTALRTGIMMSDAVHTLTSKNDSCHTAEIHTDSLDSVYWTRTQHSA